MRGTRGLGQGHLTRESHIGTSPPFGEGGKEEETDLLRAWGVVRTDTEGGP